MRNGWKFSAATIFSLLEKLDTSQQLQSFIGDAGPGQAGAPGKEAEGIDREERNQKYEDYIKTVSLEAAAIGRREPYYLTYRKKCGMKEAGGKKMQEKLQKPRRNSVDIVKIMALRKSGWSLNRIANEMNMSKQSVWNAISRWKKKHGTGGDADAKPDHQGINLPE